MREIWTKSFQLLRGIIESLGKKRARVDVGIIKIRREWPMVWSPACLLQNRIPILAGNYTAQRKSHLYPIVQQQHHKMPMGDH